MNLGGSSPAGVIVPCTNRNILTSKTVWPERNSRKNGELKFDNHVNKGKLIVHENNDH